MMTLIVNKKKKPKQEKNIIKVCANGKSADTHRHKCYSFIIRKEKHAKRNKTKTKQWLNSTLMTTTIELFLSYESATMYAFIY